jgi:hypothetical protein
MHATSGASRGFVWFGVLLFTTLALLGGCGQHGTMSRFMLTPDRIIIERRPDPVYDQLFPYYVELCATSQFVSSEKGRGGVTGHAVMYVKGACKDERAPFPQLRRCRTIATALDDPEHGAGISVGRWFRNVNWVAVPGYDLFFRGNLAPGERLTHAHFDATVREAIARGVTMASSFTTTRRRAPRGVSTISSGTIPWAPTWRTSSRGRSSARACP